MTEKAVNSGMVELCLTGEEVMMGVREEMIIEKVDYDDDHCLQRCECGICFSIICLLYLFINFFFFNCFSLLSWLPWKVSLVAFFKFKYLFKFS